MKKIGKILLVAVSAVILFACVSCNKENEGPVMPTGITEYPVVTMIIKDYGTIKMKLYPNKAPNTVCNFISLINKGFYEGKTFHRIMTGFMVQGGDPKGDGTGDPGYYIKGEFSKNGFNDNNLTHERGIVSMARGGNDMNSAGSQFFIMHGEDAGLDGSYAAFGKVTEGMEAVDEMVKLPVSDNNGTLADKSQAPIIESITVDTFGVTYPEPQTISK